MKGGDDDNRDISGVWNANTKATRKANRQERSWPSLCSPGLRSWATAWGRLDATLFSSSFRTFQNSGLVQTVLPTGGFRVKQTSGGWRRFPQARFPYRFETISKTDINASLIFTYSNKSLTAPMPSIIGPRDLIRRNNHLNEQICEVLLFHRGRAAKPDAGQVENTAFQVTLRLVPYLWKSLATLSWNNSFWNCSQLSLILYDS